MLQTRNVYILLFSLYWAQGLPVGFMTHALPVILRAQGVSLAQIGGFGLLMLPWSVKVFWAPVLDRFGITRFGHYRSWVIPLQFLTVLVLIGLSFLPIDGLNQPTYLWAFFVGLLSMNLLGATQDIATDGLAVNILKGEQQHWGCVTGTDWGLRAADVAVVGQSVLGTSIRSFWNPPFWPLSELDYSIAVPYGAGADRTIFPPD